jgi:hypothetical protein
MEVDAGFSPGSNRIADINVPTSGMRQSTE